MDPRVGPWQCIGCEEVLVVEWIDLINNLVEAGEGARLVVPREDQGRNVLLQDEELPLLWHFLELLEEVFVRNGPADAFDLIDQDEDLREVRLDLLVEARLQQCRFSFSTLRIVGDLDPGQALVARLLQLPVHERSGVEDQVGSHAEALHRR